MKKYLLYSLSASLFLFARCEYEATPDAFKMFELTVDDLGRGEAVVQNKQGEYTVAGTNTHPTTLKNTIYVAQTDRNGKVKDAFTTLFDDSSDQSASDMCLTREGNFAVVGTVMTAPGQPSHLFPPSVTPPATERSPPAPLTCRAVATKRAWPSSKTGTAIFSCSGT